MEQGVDWENYKHTESRNNPSVTSDTWEKSIIDAVADWCDRGIAAGPFETRPAPIVFGNTTIIKMMVREKSNGRARIIMDLSSPRPGSVNESIKAEKVITAVMAGLEGIVKAVNKVGQSAMFAKCDLSDTYKPWQCAAEIGPCNGLGSATSIFVSGA